MECGYEWRAEAQQPCMQSCSAFVHLSEYWCGAQQTAVNQSASQCSVLDEAAEHCETGALRQGTRDQGPGTRAVRGASFIMSIGARLVWPKDEPHHGASTPAATVPPHSPPLSSCEMLQTRGRQA